MYCSSLKPSAQTLKKAIHLFDEGNIEEGKNLLYSRAIICKNRANEHGDEELLGESKSILEKLADFDSSNHTKNTLHAVKYRQMKRK